MAESTQCVNVPPDKPGKVRIPLQISGILEVFVDRRASPEAQKKAREANQELVDRIQERLDVALQELFDEGDVYRYEMSLDLVGWELK